MRRISPQGIFAVAAGKDRVIYSSRTGELWMSSLEGDHAVQLAESLRPSPVMSWFLQNQSLYLTRPDERSHDYVFLRYRDGRTATLGNSKDVLVPNAPDVAVSSDERWLLFARQDSSRSDLKIRREQASSPKN